ncbi:MAG: hypothetical protein ACJ70O_07865 [Nitrososphaera sp.]
MFRRTPSADRPVLILSGGFEDIDMVAALVEHVAKITPSDSGARYRKVHLD